jgi:adenine-specific DNA methylase
MNFKALESEQKLRGGYYTQPDIALFLARWVLEKKPKAVLEPSCGDGAFIQAVADIRPSGLRRMVACEILPAEAKKACERAQSVRGFEVSVFIDDFLRWSLPRLSASPEFDGVLGNPPFVRYQYLDPEQQARSQQVFEHFGLPFTKHTNAWVPFIIASIAQLRPGGRLAMVVPSEILHVLHARPLRAVSCPKAADEISRGDRPSTPPL